MPDTTAPRGALLIPVFSDAGYDPYGLSNVGGFSSPTFADIDGDGDLDALIGNAAGNILLFLNTGSASSPAFDAAVANPYSLAHAGRYADPTFVDIDNDGDLDAFVGDLYGNTLLQLNTGTASSPAFAAGVLNTYGLARAGNYYASPTFADIDSDGDLDALVGDAYGNTQVQLNTGTSSAPAFAAASINPYGLADVTYNARPTLVDIDGDGDLDALIGNSFGNTLLFLNTGTLSGPAFAEPVLNPYGLFDIGHNANPAFVDIDGDGDLDVLMGDQWGDIQLFNNNPVAVIPVTTTKANGSYKAGSVITLQLHFDENVLVTGMPTLQLETGSTDRVAIYSGGSGSKTLSFEYTVLAGDESSSLDISSSSALSLNGGTIADAAGNNAILTLADPGTPGSLAFNADLAIDTKAPGGTLLPPVFLTPAINPYGLDDIGASASPSFVDIDGDGDLDAFIGERYGSTVIQLNTGTASSPAFEVAVVNPYGLGDVGKYASPVFVDIDGDGDLDAFIGNDFGNTLFFRNSGTASSPAFATRVNNPFGLVAVGTSASPSFVDLDGDGDLDALIGKNTGIIIVQLNNGTASSPSFAVPQLNPYGLADVGGYSSIGAVDIDADGDADVLIGNSDGNTLLFLNTGSAGSPAFAAPVTNPFGLVDVGYYASPSFADIDGDGDQDVLLGDGSGRINVFINNTAGLVSPVTTTNANGSYKAGSVITLQLTFDENVFVTGSPTLQLETGTTDRLAVFSGGSGTKTLSFEYTVLAGDSSTDLDVSSASALDLNGGTIADAAGNNAIVVLAAPGTMGALGDNAKLVIDTITPSLIPSVTTSNTNGSYGLGRVITLQMAFDENVIVTGTPTLSLETGAIDRVAVFSGGSGTSTLSFTYTVQAGDTSADLDFISDLALALNGGSITDAAGNRATLTLPMPGAPGSLGANADLLIETIAPTLTISSDLGTLGIGETAEITFTFSEDPDTSFVWDGSSGDITVTGGTLSAISGSGLTRTATFTPTAGIAAGTASITVAAGSYTDAAGNDGGAGSSPGLTYDTLNAVVTGNAAAEIIRGGAGNDSIDGAGGNDRLAGRDGNDLLEGGEGNDSLFGQGGDDQLLGDNGKDALNGGQGADSMTGGDGNDAFYIDDAGDEAIEINADPITGGIDTVYSYISSYTLADNIERGVIRTTAAASLTGNELANSLYGGAGNNSLDGAAGNDTLLGGAGADQLTGGADRDVMTGGQGADSFIFHSGSGRDTIKDFNQADGDIISLQSNLNGSGITDAASALAHVHDAWGSAVLDLGGGNVIKLTGLMTADLTVADFMVF